MINEAVFKIKQDSLLYEYLKYHSYWYKLITRDEDSISLMIDEMKKELKITGGDKINDLKNNIEKVSTLLELLS